MHRLLPILILCLFAQNIFAQLWQDVDENQFSTKGERVIQPQKYRSLSLDEPQLRQQLALAPMEGSVEVNQSPVVLEFPMPDGSIMHFHIVESPVMAPQLAAKYPQIKTYAGKGIEDPTAIIRFDLSQKGFHAMISTQEGSLFVDPYFRNKDGHYISYHKKDFKSNKQFICGVEHDEKIALDNANFQGPNPVGDELRTYRLGVSATVSYSTYHGGNKPDVLAAIVTSVNRINEIYIRDVSIKLELIANQDTLIYLDAASSPFSGGDYLGENQTSMDAAIGSANYDMGHVYDRGGGGVAALQSICNNSRKAQGYTSNDPPVNDPFDIDYVSHEMGHQFGGNHTFNECGGQGPVAYEPGSAITIMGYAGLCGGSDLASNSIAMFHTGNFDEIATFSLNGGGNNCPVTTVNGNTPPTVDAGPTGWIIPISTPFELTGSATDPDGDSLTYCWEQHDLGPSGVPNNPTGNAPIFRSFLPVNTPTRVFPKIQDILFGTQSIGEIMPSYARNMSFRLTVRDNNLTGGGSDYEEIEMTVSNQGGPFRVTSQDVGANSTWTVGENVLVEWDVANTDQSPINCQNVDISLSVDNGMTYTVPLIAGTPNDGSAIITVPDEAGFGRRIKVKAANNVFFQLNTRSIIINPATAPDFGILAITPAQTICTPDEAVYDLDLSSILGFNEPVTLTATGQPAGTTVSFSSNPVTPAGTSTMTVGNTTGAAPGSYVITITGTSATATKSTEVDLQLFGGAAGAVSQTLPADGATEVALQPDFEWMAEANSVAYDLEIATDAAFSNIIHTETGLTMTNYTYTGQLDGSTIFYWRVKGTNSLCGDGSFSSGFSFETESIVCESYASTDVPINIPAAASSITSTLTISDSALIRDLNVLDLVGTHTWINDLDFKLTSPAGTTVQIIDQSCGNEDNFNISLDDEATSATFPCPYNNGQTYIPSNPLSAFDGEQKAGTWTLEVTDNVNQDGGILQGWTLEICFPSPDTIIAVPIIPTIIAGVKVYPNPAKDLVNMQIDLQQASVGDISISNATGQLVISKKGQPLAVGKNTLEFDIKRLPAGVYFYEILEEKNQQLSTGKFIIAK